MASRDLLIETAANETERFHLLWVGGKLAWVDGCPIWWGRESSDAIDSRERIYMRYVNLRDRTAASGAADSPDTPVCDLL